MKNSIVAAALVLAGSGFAANAATIWGYRRVCHRKIARFDIDRNQ